MKKVMFAITIASCMAYQAPVQAGNLGVIDFVAVWLVYKAWTQWLEKKGVSPSDHVIKDIRACLNYLRIKIVDEQKAIDACRQDVLDLKRELAEYKNQHVLIMQTCEL